MGLFGQNPGSIGFAAPPDETTQLRRLRDLERGVQEAYADGTLRSLVDSLPASVAAQVASQLASGISTTTIAASGAITGGSSVTGVDVFAQSLSTLITASRVTLWGRTADGYIATASSSRRYKTNETPAKLDIAAILKMQVKHYQYIAEVERAKSEPDYHAALEIGLIAEDLHDAGLWEFVVYKRDDMGHAVLDENGNYIPEGIHYQLLALALIPVVQSQDARLNKLAARVAALDGKTEG